MASPTIGANTTGLEASGATFTITTPSASSGDTLVLFCHYGRGDLDTQGQWGQSGSDWSHVASIGLGNDQSCSIWMIEEGTSFPTTTDFTNTQGNDTCRWYCLNIGPATFDAVEIYEDADEDTSDAIDPVATADLLALFFYVADYASDQAVTLADDGGGTTLHASHDNEGAGLVSGVFYEARANGDSITRGYTNDTTGPQAQQISSSWLSTASGDNATATPDAIALDLKIPGARRIAEAQVQTGAGVVF